MNRLLVTLAIVLAATPLMSHGTAAAAVAHAAAGAAITLAPVSGPPGTVVQVTGQAPAADAGAAGNDQASQHANVCWDRCPGGLTFEVVPVQWSNTVPGQFALQFTVPSAPWLESDGPHAPVSGDYNVGIQCLTPPGSTIAGGCAVRAASLTATFHLTDSAAAPCGQDACATLTLSPPEAAPGTLIQVAGAAPLAPIVEAGGSTCCYNLALLPADANATPAQLTSINQSADGTFAGSFRLPLSLPSLGLLQPGQYTLALEAVASGTPPATAPSSTVTITPLGKGSAPAVRLMLAPAQFTVNAAPSWASLATGAPLVVQRSTPLVGRAAYGDAAAPNRVAACVAGAILLSDDDGATWTSISTGPVEQLAASTPYPLEAAGASDAAGPACVSIVSDPSHPDTLYATFAAGKAPYGPPPLVYVPYETMDGGQTWQQAPTPDGYSAEQFGGFQIAADGSVQALFRDAPTPGGAEVQPPSFAVEATFDGGSSWTPSQLACPSDGPCVRWGPAPNVTGSCAMNEHPQPMLDSTDGGTTFSTPSWPAGTNACDDNELVARSPTTVLLLSGRDSFPVHISSDGGQTWQAVALPPLPDQPSEPQRFPGLQVLPDGSLLAAGAQSWYVLPAAGTDWCAVSAALPPAAQEVQVVGDRVWWRAGDSTGSAPPQSLALSDLGCAAGG